jgi:hypothetical protein
MSTKYEVPHCATSSTVLLLQISTEEETGSGIFVLNSLVSRNL